MSKFMAQQAAQGSSTSSKDLQEQLLKDISDNENLDEITKLRMKQQVVDILKETDESTPSKFKSLASLEKARIENEVSKVSSWELRAQAQLCRCMRAPNPCSQYVQGAWLIFSAF